MGSIRTAARSLAESQWPAVVHIVVGCSLMVALSLGLFGDFKPIVYTNVAVMSVFALGGSVLLRRPAHSRHWITITAALVLFLVSGILSEWTHTLGNVTASRSLLPDLFSLPGYLLLTVGLMGFSQWSVWKERRAGIMLDATLASLGLILLIWVFAFQPFLHNNDVPLKVALILIAYPAASIAILAVTFWIALNPAQKNVPALWLLVAAVACLLLGDVGYMLEEMGVNSLPTSLVDLPYGLAYVMAAATALHPSMLTLTQPASPQSSRKPIPGRIYPVVFALSLPAIIAIHNPSASLSDRIVLAVLIMAMAVTTVLRVIYAMRVAERSEQALAFQALHDSLTGLPNRRRMKEHLTDLINLNKEPSIDNTNVALLYLDLDRFKLINDMLGHRYGDLLLVEVAERLRAHVRPTDLVTRIGGDEFIIILSHVVSVSQAMDLAERLLASLREPFMLDGRPFHVSASIGLAFASGDDTEAAAEALVSNADTAMYYAKQGGRDAVALFDDSMHAHAIELELERDLRHAVELDQLHLLYQPIVSLPGASVVGMEALLRWTHPLHGTISPAQFIPLAEESGAIIDIGKWVLGEALGQLAAWRRQAPEFANLCVSVNLSAVQLFRDDIVETVSDLLAIHGLDGQSLCLELTESTLMQDTDAATETLEKLRRLGVQMAIDDFGSEYSSLAYVKRFPVTSLKLDRDFVSHVTKPDSADAAVVAAIVAMARTLRIKTVAEGVETADQARRLHELGCDMAQGYLYSYPVEAQTLPQTVASLNAPRLRLVPAPA